MGVRLEPCGGKSPGRKARGDIPESLLYMLKFFRKLWAVAALCLVLFQAGADKSWGKPSVTRPNEFDSLRYALSMARTAQDSIPILYNIYDYNSSDHTYVSGYETRVRVLEMLYNAALRASDTASALNAVRYLSSESKYDVPYVNSLQRRIAKFPPSVDKNETDLYLNLQRYFWALRDTMLSNDERRQNFYDLRKTIDQNRKSGSIYDRVSRQFALVMYGSNFIQSDLLEKYLKDLRRYVEMLPDNKSLIKHYYYLIAAMLYDENDDGPKAVETDYAMLELLDSKDRENREKGRLYRNYDTSRFTVYRRLLNNYDHMPDDSVVSIYNKLQHLLKVLGPHQVTVADRLAIDAMWAMYNKNFKEALVKLRGVMTSKRYNQKPNYLLAYIMAASATNSEADLEKGQQLYNNLIMTRAREAADTEYARMRIEYEIDTLEASAKSAEMSASYANKKSVQVADKYLKYGILIIIGFLLVIVVVQIFANRRTKRVSEKLARSNEQLIKERDNLQQIRVELEKSNERSRAAIRQRSDFVHNVSHQIYEPVKSIVGFSQLIVDSIPEERRKYLEKFVKVIDHNGEILERIIGDLIDVSELDNAAPTLTISRFQPVAVCETVANVFQGKTDADLDIDILPPRVIGTPPENDDFGIDSDRIRFEQIVTNLVSNAVKFGGNGKITVSNTFDYDTRTLTLSVADQGPGVSPDREKYIFTRFSKTNGVDDGLGVGLFVSREFAHLLGGELSLDTGYKDGARFVLQIPFSVPLSK